MFEVLRFEKLNETDVREEVIAPLVRRLGYRSGTDCDVIREQSLRYPKLFLGRKDTKKDPELRGKADYILEVEGRLRWVIEAKAPEVPLGQDQIEQAWSYANHPEVRSIYFALCNGREMAVYRTAFGPAAEPTLRVNYEDFDARWQLIENLLGPIALRRDYPNVELDVGLPIAPGLRSVARITNGVIRYEKSSIALPVLTELQHSIRDGAVERDDGGRLVAFLRTAGPSRSLQALNERLGLDAFEMVCADKQLSIDSAAPSRFVYEKVVTIPAGEKMLDLSTWKEVQLPMTMTCKIRAEAHGSYSGGVFVGPFFTQMEYPGLGMRVSMSGTFEVHVA
jgi:hypothetical protein